MHLPYDALKAPDPEDWLDLDDQERIDQVIEYHRRHHQPMGQSVKLHGVAHAVVENQVALGDPPAVREALARLMGEGLDRHDAVHAVGSVVMGLMYDNEPAASRTFAGAISSLHRCLDDALRRAREGRANAATYSPELKARVGSPTPWELRECPCHPEIERVMHKQIRENRADDTSLRGAACTLYRCPILAFHWRFQPPFDVEQRPFALHVLSDST